MNLNVEAYESFCVPPPPEIDNDIEFYLNAAHRFGGPVLELACGTGRIARRLAQDGFEVTGVDASEAMLELARKFAVQADPEAKGGLAFETGRLEDFGLGKRFALIVIAFRSFQCLLDAQAQLACLDCLAAHLAPGGAVVIHIFDPRLDLLTGQSRLLREQRVGRSSVTGRTIRKALIKTDLEMVAQVLRQVWRHDEVDDSGKLCRQEDLELTLRWTYRHEFNHLIARAGWTIDQEFSDFIGSPLAYGRERIIVLRRRET